MLLPSINVIVEIIIVIFLMSWAFFAFLVSRQTFLLNRFLQTRLGGILYLLTLLYTGSVVVMLIWVILVALK